MQFQPPPNQPPQYPSQPEQYQQPPSYPQPQYIPPVQPPPKKKPVSFGKFLAIGCGGLVALIVLIAVIVAAAGAANSNPNTASQATQGAQATQAPTQPQDTPTAVPTQAPTVSPALLEATYKASTTDITVIALDKDGNADNGKDVHFTATISNFVKDSSGNTVGANVTDASVSSFIQIGFPTGTDISRLNAGDTVEVWGLDGGTASGTNAFGATIQEVVVAAEYMTDQATGYQAG
jgi:hypothetical protein